MITEESLKQLYIKNVNGELIEAKELKEYNLNYYDINKLIELGIIRRIERGIYGLDSFDSLYKYGLYLIENNKYHQALNILLKCLELNPNSIEVYECLFFLNIITKYIKGAYELLDKLIELNNDPYINNTYMYLLSYIMQAPISYRTKIKNLKRKQLMPGVVNKNKNQIVNNVTDVINIINASEVERPFTYTQSLVLKQLIKDCKNRETNLHTKILNLAKSEKYQQIVSVLMNRNRETNLDQYYLNILLLSQKILDIIDNHNIPSICVGRYYNTDSISQTLNFNDFKAALAIKIKKLNHYNKSAKNDIQYILLKKINDLITINYITSAKEIINELHAELPKNEMIETILNSLIKADFDHSLELIKQYLKEIGKEEYKHMIISLIQISLYKNDNTYLIPISELINLSNPEYEYNIFIDIRNFYQSIKENNLNVAKLYLNIIKQYSNVSKTIINDLENSLSKAIDRDAEKIADKRKYILDKLKMMKKKKEYLAILDPMDHPTRKLIYEIIREIPKLTSFSIGKEPKVIVLRYLDLEYTKEALSNDLDKVKLAFRRRQYQLVIELGIKILKNRFYKHYTKGQYASLYAMIGESYMRFGEYENAVKFLTVATGVNEEDPISRLNYDYKKIIKEYGKGEINIFESIPQYSKTEIKVEQAADDLDDCFGISQIKDIAYYIQEEKLSIEESCQKYNLTEEQVHLVKLIYARDYYIESMYIQGDKILQEIEKSKHKTEKVRKLLKEIRENRMFYQNRVNAKARKRILKTENN